MSRHIALPLSFLNFLPVRPLGLRFALLSLPLISPFAVVPLTTVVLDDEDVLEESVPDNILRDRTLKAIQEKCQSLSLDALEAVLQTIRGKEREQEAPSTSMTAKAAKAVNPAMEKLYASIKARALSTLEKINASSHQRVRVLSFVLCDIASGTYPLSRRRGT